MSSASSAFATVQPHVQYNTWAVDIDEDDSQHEALPKAEPTTCQKVAHYVRNFLLLLWDLPKVLLQSRAHIFHSACENNHLWTVMLFTKCGFDATTSFKNKSPLVTAAIKGHTQVVAHLAARDPNVAWKFRNSFPDGALALLPHVQAKDLPSTAKSALMKHLVQHTPLDRTLAKALVDRGFSLVPAFEELILQREGNIPDLEALLDICKESGREINALRLPHYGPIPNAAAKNSSDEVVSYLISREDLDINQHGGLSQTTFLMDLCRGNRLSLIKQLLQTRKEVDLNAVANRGRTALEIAASDGRLKLIEFLLPHLNKEDAAKQLPAAFLSACKWGHADVAKYLLTQDPSLLTAKDSDGKTALMHASESGRWELNEVADLLIAAQTEHKLDPKEFFDAQEKDGFTALMIAVQAGRHDLVQKLLKAGASPETTDHKKQNFLVKAMISQQYGYEKYSSVHLQELMQICLEKCPNIFSQKDAEGKTLIHHGLSSGRDVTLFSGLREFFDFFTQESIVLYVLSNRYRIPDYYITLSALISTGFGVTDEGELSSAVQQALKTSPDPHHTQVIAQALESWKKCLEESKHLEESHE